MCVWRPIPASCYSRPSSSPLPRTVTFMSKKMLRASCRSSTPFLLQLSLDSLPAAFASIHPCRRLSLGHICSSFLHRVHRLWCTVRLVYHPSHLAALLVLACLGLSSPCSPSLSLLLSFSLSHYSILSIHGIAYLCLAFAVKLHLAFPLLSLQARLPHRRRASPLSARRREPLPLHLLIRSCRWCKFASCHAIFMLLNVALIFRISVVLCTLLPTMPLC